MKENIAGYWEIKSVEMPDGSIKDFDINTSVDYIEVSANKGSRKKLMPQADGTFREFPTVESFEFLERNDSLFMYYKTPYADWIETVVKATDSLLVVQNSDKKEYVYRRFRKLNLTN
ncbi:MAG: hypothetical protein HKO54_12240 [Flavobacteriaceae bacterium]|nr:hypothetical protein [Flavobacteriaceae bacterium]